MIYSFGSRILRVQGYILVMLLALASLTIDDARACDLASGPSPGVLPHNSATLNAQPLLFAQLGAEPTLTRMDPTPAPVPLEVVEEFAETFSGRIAMRAWRPVAPLSAGRYHFDGTANGSGQANEANFFVDPTLPLEGPALADVSLLVSLGDSSGSGCGWDCGNPTKLEIQVPDTADGDLILVDIHNVETGQRRIELAGTSFGSNGRKVLIWDDKGRWPGSFRQDAMCVLATPITESGAKGATVDLGCFDPRTRDPRVVEADSGCTGAPVGTLLAWLALPLIVRRRRSWP